MGLTTTTMHATSAPETTQATRKASTRSGGEDAPFPERKKLTARPKRQDAATKTSRYVKERILGLNNHQSPETKPNMGNQKYHPKTARIGDRITPPAPLVQPNRITEPAKSATVAMTSIIRKLLRQAVATNSSQYYNWHSFNPVYASRD
jgi:hypothetical protein